LEGSDSISKSVIDDPSGFGVGIVDPGVPESGGEGLDCFSVVDLLSDGLVVDEVLALVAGGAA
jgi:hypothetical protein